MNSEASEKYWNNRVKKFGCTGWKIPELHHYDQKIRFKSLKKILLTKSFEINAEKRVLDVGCGVGDFVEEFAKLGSKVTGFDISTEVVDIARQRIAKYENVNVFCSSIAKVDFPINSFDLIVSITVLQHIISKKQLLEALKKIYSFLDCKGYALLFETVLSPKKNKKNSYYIKYNTRNDWLRYFQMAGFEVIKEYSYPQVGITLLRIIKKFGGFLGTSGKVNNESLKKNIKLRGPYMLIVKMILILSTPIDLWLLIPFPRFLTQQRFFLLKKG